jgi:F-type H+-transporting ATPase subunit delta
MPKRVSGQRYAQAIFELALEQGQTDEWAADLELAGQVLRDEEFRTFLNHAEVPADEKIKSVEAVLPDVHPLIRNLLKVLVTKGSANLAPELSDAYAKLLDDAELQSITQFVSNLTGKDVVVTTEVDEDIIGGIVIQIGDQLLDGSTRTHLEALRKRVRSGIS